MGEMKTSKTFDVGLPQAEGGPHLRLLAVSAMTPVLIHELAQPLGAALNHLALASRRLEGAEIPAGAAQALDRSRAAVERAAELVRRMGGFVLEGAIRARPLDLGRLVRSARSSLTAEQICRLDVTVDLGRGADRVSGDDLLIELVLRNLLVNAIEAVPAGGQAKVRVGSSRFRDSIILTIGDDGTGLTEEAHARLFEPMHTTKRGGAGLGLPLCKVIAEAHGGQLWAAEPGTGGATFYLTLPAEA